MLNRGLVIFVSVILLSAMIKGVVDMMNTAAHMKECEWADGSCSDTYVWSKP